MRRVLYLFLLYCYVATVKAQDIKKNNKSKNGKKFEQLGTIMKKKNE